MSTNRIDLNAAPYYQIILFAEDNGYVRSAEAIARESEGGVGQYGPTLDEACAYIERHGLNGLPRITYVIAMRVHYYGPSVGPWQIHSTGYATRQAARNAAAGTIVGHDGLPEINRMWDLPHGASSIERRVMRADSRMARRLISR